MIDFTISIAKVCAKPNMTSTLVVNINSSLVLYTVIQVVIL
jgi:hypothetical protein